MQAISPTNEPKVRRVAIACDAACDIRVAVDEAAALAERWNAALHGVFLEDENLFRLAGLPFGRQLTLSPAVSESLTGADLEQLSSALSAAMRRAVSEAATEHGLEWSFDVVRDIASLSALAEVEADLLVVEAAPRPFSGSWRPRSSWEPLAEDHQRTTLIRRQKATRPGTVVILLGEGTDRDKAVASGLLVAGPEDEIAILAPKTSAAEMASVREMAERLAAPHQRRIRLEAASTDGASLIGQIDRLKPVLLVVDTGNATGSAVRDLLASTQCDVLLV
jgi:hypothetical protein